jgi:hypothetical protein
MRGLSSLRSASGVRGTIIVGGLHLRLFLGRGRKLTGRLIVIIILWTAFPALSGLLIISFIAILIVSGEGSRPAVPRRSVMVSRHRTSPASSIADARASIVAVSRSHIAHGRASGC